MNIAIIDDNCDDRKFICSCLHKFFINNYCSVPQTVSEFCSGGSFLKQFTSGLFDLILMDYYMEQINGFETAKAMRGIDKNAALVFITSSRDNAIECYKVKASGYLVKPFLYEDFAETLSLLDLNRLREVQFIEIMNGYEKVKIMIGDIIYCDIWGHYTQIHTKSMGMQRTRLTFTEVTSLLPYPEFLFCYRGCLINMNHVLCMNESSFQMDGSELIPFRKKEQSKITKAYTDFIFEKVRNKKL